MHVGDTTHKCTWSKYDILWCRNCCYWSLCSSLCVRFQQNVNFTGIMTAGKTPDVRTTGHTFFIDIWWWPWSFSRTVAKLHCWIFRRMLNVTKLCWLIPPTTWVVRPGSKHSQVRATIHWRYVTWTAFADSQLHMCHVTFISLFYFPFFMFLLVSDLVQQNKSQFFHRV